MAKVEMLGTDSEEENKQNEGNIDQARIKRKNERIQKKNTNELNKPENKIQAEMTDNQLTALDLYKTYKTNQDKWLKSYRGFPWNIPMKYLIASLMMAPIIIGLISFPFNDSRLHKIIGISFWVSLISYYGIRHSVPHLRGYMLECDIIGKDLNKTGTRDTKPPIPEAMGIVSSIFFLMDAILIVGLLDINKEKQLLFMSGLLWIAFMILLGFVDDAVALKWKYKLILPFFASFALLIVYDGWTEIIIPTPLRFIFGLKIDIGILYKVYFVMLTIFWTNSINIHAGVNGLEIGQSLVIAAFISIHNVIEISRKETDIIYENHLFSLVIMIPFMLTSLSLFRFSVFPSKLFVGDTYTSFAGIVFAVWGILGHFSKTLLLFFIPQIINFVMSFPQIIGFIYWPRHRMPKFNQETYKLEWVHNHFTVLNLTLRVFGPMNEEQLNIAQTLFQTVSCLFGLWVRYGLAGYFF